MRRDAVIGLAVPAGNIENFDVRIGEAQRLAESGGAPRVAGDMDEDGGLPFRLARQSAGEIGADEGVEALRRMGEDELLAFGEASSRGVEVCARAFLFGGAPAQ